MRTALCLSGQPRNVELGYPYIYEHVLQTCTPDVFIHVDLMTPGPVLNAGGHLASEPVPENVVDRIFHLYHPLAMTSAWPASYDDRDYQTRKLPGINPTYSLRQRAAVKSVNTLKTQWEVDHGYTYDAVLRMRFDWAIRTPINPEQCRLDGVTAPNDCGHPGGINDQFAIGSSAVMNTYATLIDHMDEYWRQDGIVFCDEILLGHHLRKSGVPIYLARIAYGIIRHKDKIEWGAIR